MILPLALNLKLPGRSSISKHTTPQNDINRQLNTGPNSVRRWPRSRSGIVKRKEDSSSNKTHTNTLHYWLTNFTLPETILANHAPSQQCSKGNHLTVKAMSTIWKISINLIELYSNASQPTSSRRAMPSLLSNRGLKRIWLKSHHPHNRDKLVSDPNGCFQLHHLRSKFWSQKPLPR